MQKQQSKKFGNRFRTLNDSKQGSQKIVLIIGPTAVGKSVIIDRALSEFDKLTDIITYTTRPMRAGESEGHPYHFVSEEKFKALEAQNFFVETANVHGRLYGTPWDQFHKAFAEGKCVIADIDVQGAKKFMKIFPSVVTVFLMPPSIEVLRQRFLKRGITNQDDLDRRLQTAEREIAQANDFKHCIINDDFETAYAQVASIIEGL